MAISPALGAIIRKRTGGCDALAGAMRASVNRLDLNRDQLLAFFKATQSTRGFALWRLFKDKKKSHKKKYSFAEFMVEVLATTDHPVRKKK